MGKFYGEKMEKDFFSHLRDKGWEREKGVCVCTCTRACVCVHRRAGCMCVCACVREGCVQGVYMCVGVCVGFCPGVFFGNALFSA